MAKIHKVEEYIGGYDLKRKKSLSISLGYVYAPARGFDRIEDALSVADEKMFANKQAFKKRHQ